MILGLRCEGDIVQKKTVSPRYDNEEYLLFKQLNLGKPEIWPNL